MEAECWMGHLSVEYLQKPLNHIAIPGSHDSFTYQISSCSEIGPDVRSAALKLMKYCGQYGKRFMEKWLITQNLNATEQLLRGIRYFDIRIGTMNQEFVVTHQLFSGSIDRYLRDIESFLSAHRSEVVLLDFNHVYLDRGDYERLMALVTEVFGTKLAPYRAYEGIPSLQALRAHGHQAIAFYHHVIDHAAAADLWPEALIPTFWPNTTDPGAMTAFLADALRHRDARTFHISQGILTPTAWTLTLHPLSNLRDFLAARATAATARWLSADLPRHEAAAVNVVIADFVQEHRFVEAVLRLNAAPGV